MGDPLSDCSPLISGAAQGKFRLVRLLLEGGAQVNERNPKGETPLLAACKALRGEPTGPETIKLLMYLIQNQADPNAQDKAGRTPLMYACMERAGYEVASTLLSAGADPSMEDYSGASALVYAINARHQPTLQVLMDACRAKGRDIIIITTEMGVSGGSVTRRYLNVPPSPDTSPVTCMSPSDIIIKTGSPNSPEGENIFNFRGTGRRGSESSRGPPSDWSPVDQSETTPPRHRMWSEPWLAIHNLDRLTKVYEEGRRERSVREEPQGEEEEEEDERRPENEKDDDAQKESRTTHLDSMDRRRNKTRRDEAKQSCQHDWGLSSRASPALLLPTERRPHRSSESSRALERPPDVIKRKSSVDRLPPCPSLHGRGRRNTLPCLTAIPPVLHLPPPLNQRPDSFLQVPTRRPSPWDLNGQSHPLQLPHPLSPHRAILKPSFLPPLALTNTSLVASVSLSDGRNTQTSLFTPPVSLGDGKNSQTSPFTPPVSLGDGKNSQTSLFTPPVSLGDGRNSQTSLRTPPVSLGDGRNSQTSLFTPPVSLGDGRNSQTSLRTPPVSLGGGRNSQTSMFTPPVSQGDGRNTQTSMFTPPVSLSDGRNSQTSLFTPPVSQGDGRNSQTSLFTPPVSLGDGRNSQTSLFTPPVSLGDGRNSQTQLFTLPVSLGDGRNGGVSRRHSVQFEQAVDRGEWENVWDL